MRFFRSTVFNRMQFLRNPFLRCFLIMAAKRFRTFPWWLSLFCSVRLVCDEPLLPFLYAYRTCKWLMKNITFPVIILILNGF